MNKKKTVKLSNFKNNNNPTCVIKKYSTQVSRLGRNNLFCTVALYKLQLFSCLQV